uniref:RAB39A, member RAS oncogene family n=1 Tax=Strix occidentalis caurina TaxID=311401 RepID=A0A8D0EK25_STROC
MPGAAGTEAPSCTRGSGSPGPAHPPPPPFRLIVLGDSTVGKSCLLHRFTEGRFPGPLHSDPTVGVDFFSRLVEIEPGKRVKLQLWDTAGQERFRSITRSYYRNSVGGLLVFDITNRRSFEHVKDWLEEAKMHVQPFQIVFLLVGHKCDLVSQREVTREEAEKLSSDCGMKYIETSAKDATNVEESFTILTRDIYELLSQPLELHFGGRILSWLIIIATLMPRELC